MPPPLSTSGQTALHARWVNEYQMIADAWKGRDERQYQFYNALKNKHSKLLRELSR